MPTIDASDISSMLDEQDTGTYSPLAYAGVHPSSKSASVPGIFLKDFVMINDVETYSPVFDCATSDVSNATNGAKLTLNGVVYTVRGVQPDGIGLTRLILEE